MKRIIYFLVLTLVSSLTYGQTVDFSGNWKINKEKSELREQYSRAPNDIILIQEKNSLLVERHSTRQDQDFTTNDKFTLDGKECENAGWRDTIKKSTAVWTQDDKILKITTKIPMRDGGEMTIIEEYMVDGNNLIIASSSSSSFGESTERYVFDKQ